METTPPTLRRGWTTGACATAATKAALRGLWGAGIPDRIDLVLPRGEHPEFDVAHRASGPDWVEAGIIKDAGDDPDVTHGAMIIARLREARDILPDQVRFVAGEGVGTVTKPGLPIPEGDPAINPVPRQMMQAVVARAAHEFDRNCGVEITISIPGGEALAQKTWNPRLGILGGLSVLGTTGVVRPFSCAAWIASIHRGVDVARATGLPHVAGCTGATSETTVRTLYDLPESAMLDMGDFAGGLLKYLRRHPVGHLTIGGGIGKLTKLAQGALDLHSGRSQVDFNALAMALGHPDVATANTALAAYGMVGAPMADWVAQGALAQVRDVLRDAPISVDVVVIDRKGAILARAQ